MLKLNQQTVRNWIDQGRLPALRVGRRVRIRRSDLERVLEESSIEVAASASDARGPSAEDFWGGEPIGVVEPATGFTDGTSSASSEASSDAVARDGTTSA